MLLLLVLLLLHRSSLRLRQTAAALSPGERTGRSLLDLDVVGPTVEGMDPVDGQVPGPRPRVGLLIPQQVVLEALVDGGLDPVRVVLTAGVPAIRIVVELGVVVAVSRARLHQDIFYDVIYDLLTANCALKNVGRHFKL